MLITIAISLISLLIGFYWGWHASENTELDLTNTGRVGYIYLPLVGCGLLNKGQKDTARITVKELKIEGNMSVVKAIDISGVTEPKKRQAIEILGKYVPTKDITWIEK